MKKLLYLLLLASGLGFAQNTRVVPDCTIQFDFTAAGSTGTGNCGTPNFSGSSQPGIAFWVLNYYSTGFSGLTITVQSAADSSGAPGSWGTFGGTVLTSTQLPGSSGSNPNTATSSAFTGLAGYFPWMRVNLSGLTGSGEVKGALYGYLNSTIARSSGGGGGGGPTIAGTTNQITVTGAGCTGAGTCTISIPTNPILPGNASATGTFTAAGLISSEPYSGSWCGNGLTSGQVCTTVADIAGTAIVYVWPSTNGTSGQVLSDTGVTTCPTLPAGYPSVCHALVWTTGGSGSLNIQVNGSAIGSATTLNFAAGTNVTQSGSGSGTVTVTTNASGGGSGSSGGIGFYSAAAVTLPTSGTTYFPPGGGGLPSTTEANVNVAVPAVQIGAGFYVDMSAAIGAGNSITFTVRNGGANTAVTCTISGASSQTCNDTTHSFTPTAGTTLDISAVTSGTVVITPTIVIAFATGAGGGGGSGALTLISKQTLASPAASVSFSGITGTYTDLIVQITARGSSSDDTDAVQLQFNGDTGSNYIDGYLFGPGGGGPSSGTNSGSSATVMNVGNVVAGGSVSNLPGQLQITIGNYAGTTFLKSTSTTWTALFGSLQGNAMQIGVDGGYWNNTAAITSITLLISNGDFVTGSVFALYGRS